MHMLPKGYAIRPAAPDDIEGIAQVVNAYAVRVSGEPYLPVEHLRRYLTAPGFDLSTSDRLVLTPDGTMAGVALVMDIYAPHVHVTTWGIVPEEHQGKGIGSVLHDWAEPRARQAVSKAPPGARVTMMQTVFDPDTSAKQFLERAGYVQSRHFWRMAVALDNESPEPIWPEGITVRTVDLREDLERPLRAVDEAFRDHYGYVEGDFEQQLARSRHNLENNAEYTPNLSFLAVERDAIAGVCFCSPQSGTDTTTGYVGTLGVLRPWRKRGLGLALLLHAFRVFRDMGKAQAALHVDAESLTGATRLYEKAGMHVDQLSHEYQLELRAGKDLSTQSVE
jgi:mycothiol synthase